MSLPLEPSNRPAEYVNVTKFLNHYVATHTIGKEKTFIMKDLVKDESVAQAAAESFSKDNHILYIPNVDEEKRPIYTILKHGKEWFPAELQGDKTVLLTGRKSAELGQQSLGGTQEEAIHAANLIAFNHKGLCFPSIGIALSDDKKNP